MAKRIVQTVTEDLVSKHVWDYDIEQFANFFLACFKNIRTGEWRRFIIFHDYRDDKLSIDQTEALINFMEREIQTVIGYNNHEYDDLMLKHILINKEMFLNSAKTSEIVLSMKRLNDRIINRQRTKDGVQKKDEYLRTLKSKKFFGSMDLFMHFNTVDRVSLKQLAINHKWPNIIDLPHPPDHIVVREEIKEIVFYCDNDVNITEHHRKSTEESIKFRTDLTKLYKVNLINSNNTNIAKATIRKFYCEETGIKFEDFKDKRTFYKTIDLRTCISPKIRFSTQKYAHLLNTIRNKTVLPYKVDIKEIDPRTGKYIKEKKQFEYILQTKYLTHTIGLGGIHSNNYAEELTESKEFSYLDVDVDSFYPWLIVNEGLFPKHLGPEFVRVYKEKILLVRMKAKKLAKEGINMAENTIINEALKNTANSTFGLTKSMFSWLYDPHVATYICISGQLFLCMLMERIEELTDCVVVYSNTDGITTRIPKGSEDDFHRICQQWEKYTGFSLEYINYKRMVFKDINNYLMITADKKKEFKEKGLFVTKKRINQGYTYPVIADALYNYYINSTPVDKFIKSVSDPYAFIKAERTSQKKFMVYMHSKNDGPVLKLQKSNRWIITNGNPEEGSIIKYSKIVVDPKTNKPKATKMQKGRMMTLVNNMEGYTDISKLKIDYDFYILECWKVIKSIKVFKPQEHRRYQQKSLF
jgi:hypothetical protein